VAKLQLARTPFSSLALRRIVGSVFGVLASMRHHRFRLRRCSSTTQVRSLRSELSERNDFALAIREIAQEMLVLRKSKPRTCAMYLRNCAN
jgi:hypothetical protein